MFCDWENVTPEEGARAEEERRGKQEGSQGQWLCFIDP
jgi:hypothetical protein